MNTSFSAENAVSVTRGDAASQIVLACEHASHHVPAEFDDLGLSEAARHSHAAWDPGALGVAARMSDALDATLVSATTSRLVYDCNRPPEAADAMPVRSEVFDVPGNASLSDAERARRVAAYYTPFHDALARALARHSAPTLVTIHSFTPVYHGTTRAVEIGILHDSDARLADAFLSAAPRHTAARVERNAPYGPEHGVTHTLKVHAIPQGRLNVMIEVRNDLIATEDQQADMAATLSDWTRDALALTSEGVPCKV